MLSLREREILSRRLQLPLGLLPSQDPSKSKPYPWAPQACPESEPSRLHLALEVGPLLSSPPTYPIRSSILDPYAYPKLKLSRGTDSIHSRTVVSRVTTHNTHPPTHTHAHFFCTALNSRARDSLEPSLLRGPSGIRYQVSRIKSIKHQASSSPTPSLFSSPSKLSLDRLELVSESVTGKGKGKAPSLSPFSAHFAVHSSLFAFLISHSGLAGGGEWR